MAVVLVCSLLSGQTSAWARSSIRRKGYSEPADCIPEEVVDLDFRNSVILFKHSTWENKSHIVGIASVKSICNSNLNRINRGLGEEENLYQAKSTISSGTQIACRRFPLPSCQKGCLFCVLEDSLISMTSRVEIY